MSLTATSGSPLEQPAPRALIGVVDALPDTLDAATILALAGLPPRVALTPHDCTEAAFHRLWRAIMRGGADANLPLMIGARLPFGTYGVVDYLAGSASTLGAAFEALVLAFPLLTSSFAWTIARTRHGVRVSLETRHADPEQELIFHPFILGLTWTRLARLTETPLRATAMSFAVPAPRDPGLVAGLFGCPPRFSADHTSVELSDATWSCRLSAADPSLHRVLVQHAAMLLAERRPDDPLLSVRTAMRERLEDGEVALETIAKALGCSARTLQRRIANAGTTFQQLLDEERAAAAQALLRDLARTQAEVALSVGYSEQSAFARAFRRWTGTSPAQFRARLA